MERTESLVTLRGKIDLNSTVKNKLARQKVISCEFDELSENNLLNQIIKTTVMLLLRQKNVSPDHKSDLKKEMLFFSNVDNIDPTTIQWSRIRFQRYQIFTYVKNKEVELKDKPHDPISGMLLYAKTDEETYPDNDYKMSGNEIGVHTLDLNVEFSGIREQLDGIEERYFAYASAISEAVFS